LEWPGLRIMIPPCLHAAPIVVKSISSCKEKRFAEAGEKAGGKGQERRRGLIRLLSVGAVREPPLQ